jgi:hypothetical protein
MMTEKSNPLSFASAAQIYKLEINKENWLRMIFLPVLM